MAAGRRAAALPAASSPRHQIYGDPATMEGLERGDFAAALPRVGDRMLAVFAQPGRYMCARGADLDVARGVELVLRVGGNHLDRPYPPVA